MLYMLERKTKLTLYAFCQPKPDESSICQGPFTKCEMIPSTSAHMIDRNQDVVFELVWIIKRSVLSFPINIT